MMLRIAILVCVSLMMTSSTHAFVVPVPSAAAITRTCTQQQHQQQQYATNAPRHDVGGDPLSKLPPKLQQQMLEYQQHQQNAPKLDFATDVRTLIQNSHGFAVLSTFSKAHDDAYPNGSVVGFAVDTQGRPIFCFSGMSSHTQDILANPACSLTVASKQFKGAADARVNLMGRATLIKDSQDIKQAQEYYNQKHPGAFWTAFGDFNWFRMTVDHVRFVGGFARAGTVTADEYAQAQPDVVSEFGPHICEHMNQDHSSATIAIVKHTVPGMNDDDDDDDGPEITAAEMIQVDSLGMFVKVTRTEPVAFLPQQFKVRVPFPRPARDRGDVKKLIVEMTQAATAVVNQDGMSNE